MSVDVKTPTRTQFEHAEFPCGDKKSSGRTESAAAAAARAVPVPGSVAVAKPGPQGQGSRPGFQRQFSDNIGGRITRKRRFSERAPGDGSRDRSGWGFQGSGRRRFGRGPHWRGWSNERIVLPTKFLLGGNINDPLNLNSLSDENINRALNENTPKSSPLAVPYHRQHVQVIIPPNITDPLNLNAGEDVDVSLLSPKFLNRKKRKNKHKKKGQVDRSDLSETSVSDKLPAVLAQDDSKDFSKPMHIDIFPENNSAPVSLPTNTSTPIAGETEATAVTQGSGGYPKKVLDHIVSPVVPQLTSPKGRRRKRTSSECKVEGSNVCRALLRDEGTEKSVKNEKTSPHKPKYRRQCSHSSTHSVQSGNSQTQISSVSKSKKPKNNFIYGNYNRYYGYRNPGGFGDDSRLKSLQPEWVTGRDILDIGCNVGHVTLALARDLAPRRIVGIDIDPSLISAAKNNVRHYLSSKVTNTKKFPSSMISCYGPIAAPPVSEVSPADLPAFPNNVAFITGNYVLETEEQLDMVREEYDVILALSVTKWFHLNFGDAGLKRTFKRMYRQLRPGGKLVLEPQLWPSYKKKKNLTEKHIESYNQIQLRPEQFREYLLSREVGFSTCEAQKVPYNKAKGFQRPLQVFTKSASTTAGSTFTTPQQSEPCSNAATPLFQVGWSGTTTPTTFESHSGASTPRNPESPRRTKMETVVEESESVSTSESSEVGTRRPLGDLRTQSAPSLLETSAYATKNPVGGEEKSIENQGSVSLTGAESLVSQDLSNRRSCEPDGVD